MVSGGKKLNNPVNVTLEKWKGNENRIIRRKNLSRKRRKQFNKLKQENTLIINKRISQKIKYTALKISK